MRADVPDTPISLLKKLTEETASDPQWHRFIALYTPVIRAWLTYTGLPETDHDDALQDILVKLVAKLRTRAYNDSRARFRTYLAVIVRTTAIDHLRRNRLRSEHFLQQPLREMTDYPEENAPADFQIETQFQLACIDAAVTLLRKDPALPPLHRDVLEQCIVHGKPPAALTETTGRSVQHLYRIRKKLETLIRKRAALWEL